MVDLDLWMEDEILKALDEAYGDDTTNGYRKKHCQLIKEYIKKFCVFNDAIISATTFFCNNLKEKSAFCFGIPKSNVWLKYDGTSMSFIHRKEKLRSLTPVIIYKEMEENLSEKVVENLSEIEAISRIRFANDKIHVLHYNKNTCELAGAMFGYEIPWPETYVKADQTGDVFTPEQAIQYIYETNNILDKEAKKLHK